MSEKLSDFKMLAILGTNPFNYKFIAEVTVTSGRLWWKKSERRKIHRGFSSYWYYVDTGMHTPGYQAETLERAYNALKDVESV